MDVLFKGSAEFGDGAFENRQGSLQRELRCRGREYELLCSEALCSVSYRDFLGEYSEMCKKKAVCPPIARGRAGIKASATFKN